MHDLTIFENIEASYPERASRRRFDRPLWDRLIRTYPPRLMLSPEGDCFPSGMIARQSGDLGLAILWIVQAAMVQGLLSTAGLDADRLAAPDLHETVPVPRLIAIAHTDDRNAPMTIDETDGALLLEGSKRFITGGPEADALFITARYQGENAISRLLLVPAPVFQDSLRPLEIDMLGTISHATLTARALPIAPEYMAPIESPALRKTVKVGGMIESALIAEAMIGLLIYLYRSIGSGPDALIDLDERLLRQHRVVRTLIASALAGERLLPDSSALDDLPGFREKIRKMIMLDPVLGKNLATRLADLQLFDRR